MDESIASKNIFNWVFIRKTETTLVLEKNFLKMSVSPIETMIITNNPLMEKTNNSMKKCKHT